MKQCDDPLRLLIGFVHFEKSEIRYFRLTQVKSVFDQSLFEQWEKTHGDPCNFAAIKIIDK